MSYAAKLYNTERIDKDNEIIFIELKKTSKIVKKCKINLITFQLFLILSKNDSINLKYKKKYFEWVQINLHGWMVWPMS